MTTGNTNPKNPTAFPGFPTVFGDKEQKRMQDLQQQQTQMQQIYNQKFTSTAWQGVNPVEKAIRNIPIVRNLVSAVTPWQSGWDYGFTPAQAQQKLNDTAGQYLELVRSQKVTNLLPDIEQNMLNAALAGKPMQKESDYLPSGLGSDFNNADKVYLANMAAKVASASREQLLSGDIFNVVPSSETANFTDVSNSPTMANVSPQYILSSVAFSKNVSQISDALKEAYPPMPTQEGKDIMDFQSKETQTVDALRERAKELGIPGADVLAPDELVKRVGDQLAKTNEGQTKVMVDQKTSAMVPVTMKDDGTVWFKGEYMGTFDDKTGKVVSNYAKDYDEMKIAFPSMSDDQIDQILQQASPKPNLPQAPETTAQANNFINPATGESKPVPTDNTTQMTLGDGTVLSLPKTNSGKYSFETFRQAYYASKGWTNYGDPSSFNYGTNKAFAGSTDSTPNPTLLQDMKHTTEATNAFTDQYGKGAYKMSAFSKDIEGVLPTIAKKVFNPEKPNVEWYDPLTDIATLSSFGALAPVSGLAGAGLRLLATTSMMAAGTINTVRSTTNTIQNWDNMTSGEKVGSISGDALSAVLTAAAGYGVKLTGEQASKEVMGVLIRSNLAKMADSYGVSLSQSTIDALTDKTMAWTAGERSDFLKNIVKATGESPTSVPYYEVDEPLLLEADNMVKQKVGSIMQDAADTKATMPTYQEVKTNMPVAVQESIDQKTSLLVNKGVPQDQAEGLAFKEATSTEAGKSQVANAVTAADRTIPTSKTALYTQIARLNTKINNTAEHLAVWQSSYEVQTKRLTQMQEQNKVGYEVQEQQTQVANIKRNVEGLQTQLGTLGKSLKILEGSKVTPVQPSQVVKPTQGSTMAQEAPVVPNPTNETTQVAPTPSTDISTTWDSLTPDQRLVKIEEAGIAKTASGKLWKDLTDVQQARLGGTPEVVESTHQKIGNFEIMEDANGEVIICD